jgi:dipeptidase E
MGGSGEPAGPLARWFLGLTGRERPRVCFLPTAMGDADWAIVAFYERFPAALCEPSHVTLFGVPRADVRGHLLGQDAIYVSGGNTANMLAVWAVHGVDTALREAWGAGIVLGGPSAGGICWFETGITDSFGPELALLPRALGFLPGSFCPHYDGEPGRRPAYERQIREGALPAGWAADDAVALHFEGTELVEVVTERDGATAYRVERRGGEVAETPLEARLLA